MTQRGGILSLMLALALAAGCDTSSGTSTGTSSGGGTTGGSSGGSTTGGTTTGGSTTGGATTGGSTTGGMMGTTYPPPVLMGGTASSHATIINAPSSNGVTKSTFPADIQPFLVDGGLPPLP